MENIGNIKVGQVYRYNRPKMENYTLHVIGICVDMKGKWKIVVQMQYPPKRFMKEHYCTAKLVSPQYFYGMSIKIEPTNKEN